MSYYESQYAVMSDHEFVDLYKVEINDLMNSGVGSYCHNEAGYALDRMYKFWKDKGKDTSILTACWPMTREEEYELSEQDDRWQACLDAEAEDRFGNHLPEYDV